jgi:hypothetical protein
VNAPVATGLQSVRNRVLAEAASQELRALRDALLPVEDEFNVTFNPWRIYAPGVTNQ